jgi:hypothetical protein
VVCADAPCTPYIAATATRAIVTFRIPSLHPLSSFPSVMITGGQAIPDPFPCSGCIYNIHNALTGAGALSSFLGSILFSWL